nr:hypothetical protein [Dyella sp. ASV24]
MSKRERHAMHLAAKEINAANPVEGEFESIGLTCPCCGQLIRPKVLDYLPRNGTFKQYQCVHCASWLTIDLRSRIKLIIGGTVGTISLLAIWGAVSDALGIPLSTPGSLGILPFALLLGGGISYALALYTQRTAKWVPVTEN